MTKAARFTPEEKKAFMRENSSFQRALGTREELQHFLIVSEGTDTEPRYFDEYKKDLLPNLVQLKCVGKGRNTLSLVDAAILERTKLEKTTGISFEQTWVVYDKDDFPKDYFDMAIPHAKTNKMECAWSNEAFELWYYLHFQHRTTAIGRKELNRKLSGFLGEPYDKADLHIYRKLQQIGNNSEAIKRARWLHQEQQRSTEPPSRSNPCTTVYLLVEELNKFKKDRNRAS